MSRGSKVTSEFTGAPFASWPGFSLVLMIRDGLREFRLAQRQQRMLLQLAGEKPQPDSAQAQNGGQIRQREIPERRQGPGSEFRTRQPVQVQAAHGDEPHANL